MQNLNNTELSHLQHFSSAPGEFWEVPVLGANHFTPPWPQHSRSGEELLPLELSPTCVARGTGCSKSAQSLMSPVLSSLTDRNASCRKHQLPAPFFIN